MRLLVCALILAWPLVAAGQVNIERIRVTNQEGLSGSVGGDVEFRSGNAELFEVGATARVDYGMARSLLFFVGHLRYAERKGTTFRNSAFGHLRFTRDVTDRLVGEVFTQAERDGFTLLQIRLLAGTGLRFRYVRTEAFGVFQGTTLMVEHEQLEADRVVVHPAELTVLRWSNYVNVRLRLNESTRLVTTVYAQPRLDAFADVRLLNDTLLEVGLTKHVALTTGFNLRYDSRPPDDIADLDVALRNGVRVRW
ncbi:MAG: DUF481 domain-containing protein [Bacteroidota bacterium]